MILFQRHLISAGHRPGWGSALFHGMIVARALRCGFSLTALFLAMVLGGWGCATKSRKETSIRLRVMTYNIHHGEGLDRKLDLDRIARVIQQEGVDIVALQEVDRGTSRTGRRDMPAELAKLTGLTCVFSNNFSFGGGEYGNAVLTRYPVKSWKNTHYPMVRPSEQRGLLQLELDIAGVELVFFNTHLDYNPRNDDSERWASVAAIEAAVRPHLGKPVVLCGDFNATPNSRVYQRLRKTFEDTWAHAGQGEGFTAPAGVPVNRIDYLWFLKGPHLKPVKVWVPESSASDHRPVVAEFVLSTAQPPRR
jgi:endonuclease/exonuclease/phosphatase family metal-dependent hydrolase